MESVFLNCEAGDTAVRSQPSRRRRRRRRSDSIPPQIFGELCMCMCVFVCACVHVHVCVRLHACVWYIVRNKFQGSADSKSLHNLICYGSVVL